MTQIDGRAVLEAIHYVRDFYRTAAKLLLAADGLVADRGWAPHGSAWKPTPRPESLGSPDRLLPHYVIRQYRREQDREKKELLTLGVIPHDPIERRMEEPLCLASRMRRLTNGNELYWLPQQQLCTKSGIGPLGTVRHIHRDDLIPKPDRLAQFAESVEGDELLSIAVPLVSVGDEQALLSQVLQPILDAEYAALVPTGAVEPMAT